jgi:acyl carrier protein
MQTITPQDVLTAFVARAGEPESVPAAASLAEATFDALGYDSLALIAAVDEIEDRFGVEIPERGLLDLVTVGQLTDLANGSRRAAR